MVLLGGALGWYFYDSRETNNTANNGGNDAIPCYLREDLVKDLNVTAGDVIKSPLIVKGQARGCWFFEASFPVRILDGAGRELGVVPAQAKDEWMTEEFVPFEATLNFTPSTTAEGTLVIEKDNPSGLPENDKSVRIPIRFK